MKQQLRQIYEDLSNGRLSQQEALEKIKAIKLQEQSHGAGILLATPVWQSGEMTAPVAIGYAERHVILCERPASDGEQLASRLPQSHCVALQADAEQSIAQRYGEYAHACFDRIRSVLQAKPHGKVLVQIVVSDDRLEGLSGLLRTAALENPQIAGQLIAVPDGIGTDELARRLEEEQQRAPEPQLRYEQNVRQVLRWQEVSADEDSAPAFRDGGVYLITGGLGALGLLFAKEILGRTSEARVVLTGRSPLNDEKRALLSDRMTYRQLDLDDLEQVQRLVASIREEGARLDGILHVAGMLADNFILKKSSGEFREVLGPKVTGTYNLDEATREIALDFFVLFSSVAGAMGNVGQADYAAANAFMDRFAAHRNRQVAAGERHGRTRSINWSLWQAGAMGADPATSELLQQSTGIQPMRTATGLDAFHRALAWPYDQLLVAEGDVTQMRRALHAGRPAEPEQAPAPVAAPAVAIDADCLAEKTEEYLRRQCAELLKLPVHAIDPQAALEKYGIDSILAMKLTGHLEKTFGTLSKTLFFEYQTIHELAGYFAHSHAARVAALFPATEIASAPAKAGPQLPVQDKRTPGRRFTRRASEARKETTTEEPVAIIGLSGRYPEAIDVEAYWGNLRDGKDCIIEVPKERWDWREYFSQDRTESGRHYSKWGGFIAGVDEFDPLFFNISPKEAKQTDPQERLFLQHAWMAIEDAGYTRASLQIPYEQDLPAQVGVYVGVMYTEYQLFSAESSVRGKHVGVATGGASIANRVSYVLNLHGPSVTLDTMCSSSLTAIHFACLDLKLGRTSMAIAGGVNVSIHPNKYLFLSAGQFISSDGHCQSFGEGGDGYIPGEGVGVVILKRLSDAERDGDHIYGVIRGSALNHGGKTNGYTVPNPQAQATVISRALAEARTDARHVSYLEAHGTGTKLGDPIEITALSKAFARHTQDTGFCLIGSAKSNIGHCESAAGIAGLTKVLLQMQHQQIVPSLHSAKLNPHIDFDKSPFTVNQTLRPWEQPVIDGRTLPRIAGISSFGAGGSNAHMIVEEYAAPERPAIAGPFAIVLSARTPEQLEQKARDLLSFVSARRSGIDLASMAFTLQLGREAMDERLGFVVSSIEELADKLQAYVSGQQGIEDAYTGSVKRNREALALFATEADLRQTVEKWLSDGKLSKLVDLWVKGLELDWTKLHADARPVRMSLPAYPFAKERYWMEVAAAAPFVPKAIAAAVLHPLLHTNTSDLDQQSYSSTFRGDEPFLKEVDGQKVLPASAYLEMARVAVEKAAHVSVETVVELRDVIWAQPVVVAGDTEVSIALLVGDDQQIDFEIYSEDVVHCQGRAVLTRVDAARANVDGEVVAQLRLNDGERKDYVLAPSLIDDVLQAATKLIAGEPRRAFAIDALRILAPCTAAMAARVRLASDAQAEIVKFDIDLCDEQGAVAAQLRGVSWRPTFVESGEPYVVTADAPAAPAPARREIILVRSIQTTPAPGARRKPTAIPLTVPSAMIPAPAAGRKPITLAAPQSGITAPAVSTIALFDEGSGIFSIQLTASANDAIAQLLQAIERVQQEPSVKVVLLSGIERAFPRGGRDEQNDAVEQKLHEAIASFPYPVIAVLENGVTGAGFLAAALCDFMVCNEDASYGYTLHPAAAEVRLFTERFGTAIAHDLLYVSTVSTGRRLRAKGWTTPIVPKAQVETSARELASSLAAKSRDALRLLKQHLTRFIVDASKALTRVELSASVDASADSVRVVELGRGTDFRNAFDKAASKAVVLVIDDVEISGEVVQDVQRTLTESRIPAVAALTGNARGNAWLVAQLCDAAVYNRQGVYTAANVSPAAAALFSDRFGSEAASEILLTGAAYSGAELQQRVGAITVADDEEVRSTAVKLAASWAKWPSAAFESWTKPVLASAMQEPLDETVELIAAPVDIPLQSRVVTATAHPGGIVVVRMEDRDAKNMFSEAFVAGVREAFARIGENPAHKVVILTGYDTYFASGGTKETLLAIQEGRAKFTDDKIFQVPLECSLPVVAAIQGHGIGAGWCLGMFADVVVLSAESRYVSPYMNYGFTPGAGATYILPETIGRDLARESLLTAQTYTGRELEGRGLRLRVVTRTEVQPAAMTLARQIARSSRARLIGLKQQLTAPAVAALEETYRRELSMHEQTFVGRTDTLAQIQTNFHQEAEAAPVVAPQPQAEPAAVPGDLLEAVTATLRTLLAGELQMRESDVDVNAQFVDLGLDSIGGVSWIRKINQKYQTSIEATKIYGYPTLAQLSRVVKEEAEKRGTLAAAAPAPVAAAPVPVQKAAHAPRRTTHAPVTEKLASRRHHKSSRFAAAAPASRTAEPIAVIGMAGQFPQAKNLDEFWRNLAEGRNCITQVPRQRWDLHEYYQAGEAVPGKTYCQWLGSLEEYDLFDPLFFNISPTEAESMDPQQRLFLQAAWHSIENAGYDTRSLSGSKCGVFVGCAIGGDYHQVSREHQLSAQGFTGSATSILAARISYFLNLQGPCISIDTACSSSLVAIAQACDSLLSGDSDLALAGGVCVLPGPDMHIKTAQAGMLSPEGKCFTFDQRADGFVPGEGVGVVVLKRLSDAQRDGDMIYGVVEGWGVNQDGKTNGITAPNPESQTRLEQYVYDKYQIDPANIQLVEAHGTGTKLGDPIEVEGLKNAFRKYTQNEEYCAMGSVKSNIGHTLTAAGVAGVIKLILALQNRQLPPTINFERLNEHIDLTGSPFYVNAELQEWKLDGAAKRQAAISSFGFSGTNAHVVVGEYLPPVHAVRPAFVEPQNAQFIVPLSARTPEQLRQKAADLLEFLRRNAQTDLADVAYTLQLGREAMDERLGFIVTSVSELIERLQAYVDGDTDIRDFHQGQVRRNRESLSIISQDEDVRETIVEKWFAKKKLARLLDLWVRGLELDWRRFYGEVKPRRIALPAYPFAKERYWIDAAAITPAAPGETSTSTAVLHALLHTNTSDFNQQSYRSTFSGREFFLTDHQVRTDGDAAQKVLPGVAYLEMARAAIEHAVHEHTEAPVLELRDVVWARPIVVHESATVDIALMRADDGHVEYEIYSGEGDDEVIHCQGRAILSRQPAPARIDLAQLQAQMTRGRIEPGTVYATCARMGLLYGPSFQGIQAIHRGADQVLAQLRLPKNVETTSAGYVLHPTLLDSAVQAAIGLVEDPSALSNEPRLPFAVESLRIVWPCSAEMVAWVRYSPGSHASDSIIKLDIDLCDERGNVCVQMRGFALRVMPRERAGNLLAVPVWQASDLSGFGDIEYAEHHAIVCELPASADKNIAQRYREYAVACFERIQAILQSKPQGRVLVQIAVPDDQEQVLFAGLSALLKTASLENPQFTGQLVLVPADGTSEELARLLQAERSRGTDPVVRYEAQGRQVLRWQEVAALDETTIAFRNGGVYLITGGLGALGLVFAKEILAQAPEASVVLTGRSALTAEKRAFLSNGMTYREVDLGDLTQVERLIGEIQAEYGRLDGILHVAGMLADDYIVRKSAGQFLDVLEPKVNGTFNIDRASRDVELDFFVLFSSVAGAMGNLGQSDYAAANGFLDQFAAYRNRLVAAKQRHGRTRSINWPLWQAGGMAIDAAHRELLQQATGLRPMRTATGVRAFHRVLALPYDQVLVGEGDLAQMRRAIVAGTAATPAETRPEAPAAVWDAGDLTEQTQDFLRAQLSALLKLAANKIDVQAEMEKYGIDSILALKLTTQLEKTFGSLPKTLFFEYQTIRDLAGYFMHSHADALATLFAAPDQRPVAAVEPVPAAEVKPVRSRRFQRSRNTAPAAAPEADPIAIIGLSGRYPEAADIEAYWENLRAGKDCIIEVPKERWDWREYFTEDRSQGGSHYSKWGGFITGVDEFDALFFNIAPREAKNIDPQERLFLQHAWMAIEDAGYTRAGLQVPSENDLPGQVGVYAGLMYTEYQLFGAEASLRGNRTGIVGSAASIANRVSYALNLHGPSMTLDTMCSSSLTAIHLACEDLRHGRTSLAIAGGVNVTVHPNKYLMLSAGQFISSDGHCQSFGEGGDGYIPGEGVGVVVLKRLSEAKRDGDHIYGVIRGSALNHGGKTNGYSVPNPQAQAGVISRALAESHTDPRHISYIEAHGTGTKLGDPIEIAALNKAFQQHTKDTQFCLIGSAKSNIGHCESAAGVAGLTKVLLQMQHRQIVPSLHSAQLNPHIDFASSPFTVNQELQSWEQPVVGGRTLPRIAGISSFGAGGSNAHLIVEEYVAPQQAKIAGPFVILLSARTPEQLQQKARDLSRYLRAQTSIDLASVAWTLQTGREAMDERLGFVAASVEEVIDKLQAFLTGEQGIEDGYQGQVKRNSESLSVFSTDPDMQQTVEKWIAGRRLAKLLDLWAKGLEIDWSKLYGDVKPQRVSLPAYPFAKDRYWIDVPASAPAKAAVTAFLHPLLHRNTSNLDEQRYSSSFTGDEMFIAEGQLPAVACLEMARAAIEHALSERPQSAVLELRDIVWSQAIVVREKQQIHIALFASGNDEIEFEIYGDEIVYCQGRAVLIDVPAPLRLDGTAVHVRLPKGTEIGELLLHPTLLAGAFEHAPVALASVRIFSPCTPEVTAWVRRDGGLEADIDLCDAQGNVCAQLRGWTWESATVVQAPSIPAPVAKEKIVIAARAPKDVPLIPIPRVIPPRSERRKPAAIALTAPSAVVAARPSFAAKPSIALSRPASVSATESSVRLTDYGDGVFAIRIDRSHVAQLRQALDALRGDASVKVVTIDGIERLDDHDDAVDQQLYAAIAAFPYPVIATLKQDTIGSGFLFAALCDFLVCDEDARYGFTAFPSIAETVLFSERFGDVRAHDLLYGAMTATGSELRAKGWTCTIVPAAQVETSAQELVSTLAAKSRDALRLLKEHLTRRIASLAAGLGRTAIPADVDAPEPIALQANHLRLQTPAENVLLVTLFLTDEHEFEQQVAELADVFAGIRQNASYKAVVLASEHPEFLPADVVLDVQRVVEESEIPVIAALSRNARGNAWLTAQFCDACVYSREGVYSSANIGQTAAAVFAHRFGNAAAREILLTGTGYSGSDLQRRVGAVVVADQDCVLSEAVRIATSWARASRSTLTAWKKHATATLQAKIRGLRVGWERKDDAVEPLIAAPTPIELESRAVSATAHPGGIVVVKLEDRDAKNMFSEALTTGIAEVFAHIERTPAYKVVVLTGYDHYFASGGTKESLLAIQAGKVRFTDSKIFQLPLDCKLPVIAAMQGHGIGAGWSLGMFADIALLSEESRYVSPYMDYGFTPGAGATWSLPDKLGEDIARESLLTAQTYTGSALKARGVLLSVLPRAEVHAAAMALARQIAQTSRCRLIDLKHQLTAYVHEPLEETYRRELAMHEETFVGRSDTLAQIESNFHQEAAAPVPAQPQPQRVEPAKPRVDGDVLPAIAATLKSLLANELLMRESDIDDKTQFVDLGLDSISGVSWIRKINEKYQTSIEATKVYSYPTLAQLSRYVKAEAEARGTLSVPVATPEVTEPAAVAVPVASTAKVASEPRVLASRRNRRQSRVIANAPAVRTTEPIAIIGMAGQFPQAKNLDEFWRNLAEGRNCISQVPRNRWDVDAYYQPGDVVAGKTNSQWVGALDEYAVFDPLFFNISPAEAEFMDPQQRLFLQACWHSIEDAGYDARLLSGSKCGVFVGCATGDYHQLSRAHQLTAQGFTGTATSILAARISYFMNLQGPCVSIDTACSSSLVAIAQACDSLNSHDSDLALAGGVYVMAGPEMHIRTAQAGMLSAEGTCYTFDQRANGFVPGEGVGVVVLKRLSDAQRDRDVIYGVIEGWGVNQDGRTNGITAPNPESQTRLELDVYEKYRIDPANIQLIEAHGTATKLGDPIEVEGLKAAFGKYTQKTDYCAIGSVKSNIGHTLTAAGIAGTIKLLLALKHKQLPPTINFERLNEHIDLTGSPFFVNTRLQDWELRGAQRRLAAISSFGFSGTNAHIVVGEYVPQAEVARVAIPVAPVVVPLSARTPEQLREKALDLLSFIRNESADLEDVAYTLQIGRVAMDERVAFIVSSVEQLAERLQAYVDGRPAIEDVYQGQVKRNKEALSLFTIDPELQETIDRWIANRKLTRIADLWVKGLDLDWNKLHGEAKPRRISLPLYPFAKEHYWISTPAAPAKAIGSPATAVLHPLLHSNTSDLFEHRYSSTFTGDESFLAGPVLPGLALLEMARAAVEHALPVCEEWTVLELHDVVWAQPVVVDGTRRVHITLSSDDERIEFEIYGDDVVHCQGRAVLSRETAPERVDREDLTPISFAGDAKDFVLHPSLLDAAVESTETPFELATLRIFAPCAAEMFVRRTQTGETLDVDLCDADGNVAVQLRGLVLRTIEAAAPEQTAGELLASPVWQTSALDGTSIEYAEHHVIVCELPSEEDAAQRYSEYAVSCFERIQDILQRKPRGRVLVQIAVDSLLFAGLSALLRTAALENPQLTGQLIVVTPGVPAEELNDVLQAEKSRGRDSLVRYENGVRQVVRWREVHPEDSAQPVALRDQGVYLITGGLGGLGTIFTREILEQSRGAKIVLTGRAAFNGEMQAHLDGLSPFEGRVSYRQVDLSDLDDVRALIAGIQTELGPLAGILHVAGMNADDFIVNKDSEAFRRVLAPKVTGTWNLDQATRNVELDFFVLFSSIAGVTGNAGQADYATANAFLDQFAAYRNGRQRHGRTRSINWSLWQAGGMHVDAATQELVRQTAGIEPIRTATGLQAFRRSLALPHDQLLVVEGAKQKIAAYLRNARIFEPSATVETPAPVAKGVAASLDELQQQLRTMLGAVVRIEPSRIDIDQPFNELGLDSFLGAELVVAINGKFGTELTHIRLFDYSTVRALSLLLQQEVTATQQPVAPVVEAPARSAASVPALKKKARGTRRTSGRADDRIAIVGMSGRYPKADDLNEYWENLAEGRNCVTEVPASRWDANRYYDPDRSKQGKTNSKWLGAVDDVDCFDPLFFRISPQEAESMDPQHRLFLQESYRAFEDAGYSVSTLSNRKCGVYLGISTSDYLTLISRNGVLSASVTSNSYAIGAARIAYYLNLKGPAISVDTACSSSLVAVHLACQALMNGEIDMALAGGVTLWLAPESYVAMSQAGMFSPSGQCKTFDDSADGIVNGDGVGAVVLKRLSDAEADGDVIHGVILGSGINQDGKTNGITAPSVNSQIELERGIYAKHRIDPETISYVETHGTGTRLGDPIELEALSTVFQEKTSKKNYCALGAVKSNIGHTTSAAGVAGLHKVLLSMRHRTLVPTLNVTKENSRFDFTSSPFYISRERKTWDVAPGALRRAAVSSFGFSGTNSHLVVEEYPAPAAAARRYGEELIVPLSARTAAQLRQKSRDLLAFLRNAGRSVDLASLAYTLQTGREAMEERLGFIVSSVEQLTEKLAAWLNGETVDGVHQGRVEPGSDGMALIGRDEDMQEAIEKWVGRRKLSRLLDLWVRGMSFDWQRLYGQTKPRRVSLPAYPFAKQRCWIPEAVPAPAPSSIDDDSDIDVDMKSIEHILNQLDDDAIETERAIEALKMLV